MDSTVGEPIENSVKTMQPCEPSSLAEKQSVPVDEELEDVETDTDRLAIDAEHECVRVNGLSHNSTTNNADETDSIVSIDTPAITTIDTNETNCIETFEVSDDRDASTIDEDGVKDDIVVNEANEDTDKYETSDENCDGEANIKMVNFRKICNLY